MQRRLNNKLLFKTLACLLLVMTAVHLVHGHQMQRNASALARQAARAMETKDYGKAADLLSQYLQYEANDTEAMATYAFALQKASSSGPARLKTYLLLEQVLRRQPDRREAREQAVQAAIDVGRFDDAIRHLQFLLAESPKNAELEHQLGWCQEAAGQYDAAAKSLQRAVELAPDQVESYILLADLLARRFAQAAEADKVMDTLVSANPTSWRAALARGRYHYGKDRLSAAAADIYRACALAPRQDEVLLAGAKIALLEGALVKAHQLLSRGLELFPKNERRPLLLGKLGRAMLFQGDKRQAESVLRQVAELLPDDLGSRILLFDLALSEHRDADAQALLADFRRIEGNDGVLWRAGEAACAILKARQGDKSQLELARLRLAEVRQHGGALARANLLQGYLEELDGRLQQAMENYYQAVLMGERPPAVVLRLAHWLVDQQRFPDASQVLRQLEEQMPLPRDHARLAAEVALLCDEPTRAASCGHAAVPANSRDFREQLWLAEMLWLAGRPFEAEDTLRAAVQTAPRIPDVWVALVRHLTRTKQPQQVDFTFQEMVQKIPADRLSLTQARCLEAAGKLAEAEAAYRQLLAENAADFVAARHIAEFYLHSDQPAKAEPLLVQILSPSALAPADLVMWARRQLAIALALRIGQGDMERALSLLNQNAGPFGPMPEDDRVRGFVLSKNPARLAEAISLFEQTLAKKSLAPDERFLLAQLYDANHDDAKASRQMTILLALHRYNPQYLAYQIKKLLEKGAIDAALPHLMLLEQLEPASPRTLQLRDSASKKV